MSGVGPWETSLDKQFSLNHQQFDKTTGRNLVPPPKQIKQSIIDDADTIMENIMISFEGEPQQDLINSVQAMLSKLQKPSKSQEDLNRASRLGPGTYFKQDRKSTVISNYKQAQIKLIKSSAS